MTILPTGKGSGHLFVDLSRWNSQPPKVPIDWVRAKAAGVTRAYIKATQNDTWVDPWFTAHWQGASAAGVLRGAYHYFDARISGPAQAQHFLETVGAALGELPLAVDVEEAFGVTPSTLTARLNNCLTALQAATGEWPVIYTSAPKWDSLTKRPAWISRHKLWLAAYPGPPKLPAGASEYWLHQYTSEGHVEGIEGPVDLNVEVGAPPAPPTVSIAALADEIVSLAHSTLEELGG